MQRKPKLNVLCLVSMALVLSASLELAAAEKGALRAAVEAANRDFIAKLSRGDAASLAAMYATSAKLLPPNSDIVVGKKAIEQFWQGVINSGVKGGVVKTLDVEQRGDTAFETGTYTLTGEGGKVLDTGKYVAIWKRQQGNWKLHRDIWNTSMPKPGQ